MSNQTTTTITKPAKVTTPKLVCNITGVSRTTTAEYLAARLASLGIAQGEYLNLYCSKDAMKMLRAGKTVTEIQDHFKVPADLRVPITAEESARMLVINGKQKGGAAGPALSPRVAAARAAALSKTPAAKVITKPALAGATK